MISEGSFDVLHHRSEMHFKMYLFIYFLSNNCNLDKHEISFKSILKFVDIPNFWMAEYMICHATSSVKIIIVFTDADISDICANMQQISLVVVVIFSILIMCNL